MWISRRLSLPLLSLLAAPLTSPAESLFRNASWQYLDGPSAPAENWNTPGFPSTDWKSGNSPLGYGEPNLATNLSFGTDADSKPVTAWFRRDFQLRDLKPGERVYALLAMDDGAAIYLNGSEIARPNLPEGPLKPDTAALRALSDSNEGYYLRIPLPSSALKPGALNTLAVEVHQADPASSDLFFDLSLTVLPPHADSVTLTADAESVVRTFRESHRIDFDTPIPDGYIDGGRRMKISSNGTASSTREIILVDRKADPVLNSYIAHAANLAKSEPDARKRLQKLVAYVHDLNTPDSSDKWLAAYVDDVTEEFAGKPLMLGALLDHCESGVCRHRSLLLKILGDAASLPTALVRGNYHVPDSNPLSGAHAWNEVRLTDGPTLLVDVMHNGPEPKFIPTTDPSLAPLYLRENDRPWYGPPAANPSK
jgi:hypothetical protein